MNIQWICHCPPLELIRLWTERKFKISIFSDPLLPIWLFGGLKNASTGLVTIDRLGMLTKEMTYFYQRSYWRYTHILWTFRGDGRQFRQCSSFSNILGRVSRVYNRQCEYLLIINYTYTGENG